MRAQLLCVLLFACTTEDSKDGEGATTDATTDDGSGTTEDTEDTGEDGGDDLEPPVYTQGACPALTDGVNADFVHTFGSHNVRIELPADPTGAPVLFAWHWLGGSASDIVTYMDLDTLADEQGVIVVAPNSAGSIYEWEFLASPDENPDLALFEDLLACLHEQYAVDLSRIWTMGMSAGGLWTTYLTMYESQYLAASAPLSGGTFPGTYVPPESTLPVMVTWGGETDLYGSGSQTVDFAETSQHFSSSLQADGHFVVECVHDRGHDLPPNATELVWTFLSAHVKDAPSPWTSGLPEEMPSWCQIP